MALLSMCMLSHVHAQDVIRVDTLPEFTVLGGLSRPAELFHAQKWTLDSLPVLDINELLGKESGLYVKDYGPGAISTLNYRGAGANQHRILWNGMPIESPSTGLVDLSTLPTALLSSAELFTGPEALMLGSGAIGSALSLNSAPSSNRSGWHLRQGIAPYLGLTHTQIRHQTSLDAWKIAVGLFRTEADNRFDYTDDSSREPVIRQRENAEEAMYGASLDVSYGQEHLHRTTVSIQHVDVARELPAVVGVAFGAERQDDTNTRAMLRHERTLFGGEHEWATGFAKEEFLYEDAGIGLVSPLSSNTKQLRWSSHWELGKNMELRTRLEHLGQSVETPNYEAPSQQNIQGAYVEWQLQESKTRYLVALRQEWVDGRATPLTGTVAIEHCLDDRFSGIAKVGKSYRVPTMNERFWNPGGVPDLLPEEGFSVEFGLRYQVERLQAEVELFRNEMEQLILWNPTDLGYWSPMNLEQVTAQGVECRMVYALSKNLEVAVQGIYTSTLLEESLTGSETSTELPYQPRWNGRAAFSWKRAEWTVNVRGNYQGEVFTARDNGRTVPASYPIDLSFSKQIKSGGQRIVVAMTMHNILDQEYALVWGRPLPGRYLMLKFDFILS